jgi:group I intron endonuclease
MNIDGIENETLPLSGIYGLRCKSTNKWYVGQSTDVMYRWNKYYKRLNCKGQRKLYNALKKYGYNNFDKIVIEKCDPIDWIMGYREIYWIKHFNSLIDGYNLKEGGLNGGKHSKETKDKISKSKIGIKISDETKAKMSLSKRGKKFTKEHKDKLSLAAKKRKSHVVTVETRLKMGNSRRGKKHSNETKAKISASNIAWCNK